MKKNAQSAVFVESSQKAAHQLRIFIESNMALLNFKGQNLVLKNQSTIVMWKLRTALERFVKRM